MDDLERTVNFVTKGNALEEFDGEPWLHIPRRMAAEMGLVEAVVYSYLCELDRIYYESSVHFFNSEKLIEVFPFVPLHEAYTALCNLCDRGYLEIRADEQDPDGYWVSPVRDMYYWEGTQPHTVVCEDRDLFKESTQVRSRAGYVYLLEGNGCYKIGRAADLDSRVTNIATQMPFPVQRVHSISTPDCVELENYWHRRFKSKRLNGEWFNLTPEDVAEFCAVSEMDVAA